MNTNGKVVPITINNDDRSIPEHGLYVSGWLKRGPSGIIGTNISDAKDTVSTIMSDIDHLLTSSDPKELDRTSREELRYLLTDRNIKFVNWSGYQKIDHAEMDIQRKRSELQPREKFTSISEMLVIANESTS